MAKGGSSSIPPDRLERYALLVATPPGVERKGAKMPYTSVNGHMTSFLTEKGTLALRLSELDRTRFMAEHGAALHEAHGAVLKEYVSVPDVLLADVDALAPWFAVSVAYVASLSPKPARRGGGRT